jgi:hypothetical protein
MDEIVKLAMAKWPKVPHCYGWLALDARGMWRMRDEAAQALGLAGEPIRHAALLTFINRNYAVDERGCWYFQNGPQRVYLNLALTPYIARLDPAQGMLLQTGQAITTIDQAWLSDQGRLIFQSGGLLASLDDRDWVNCVEQLRLDGKPLTEEDFANWLESNSQADTPITPERQLCWHWQQQTLVLSTIVEAELGARFGFQPRPQA